ncbi:MAG: hypothetical protein ACRDJV_10040 [Actinomycetota bacterium]
MYARVAVYEIPGHRMGEAVAAFGDAIDQIRELSPQEVYLLVSRDDDRALTMSVWDTPEAMEASRVKASGLRSDAVGVVGGSVQSVVEYEVAIHERTKS